MEEKRTRAAGIRYTLLGGICWGLSGCFGQFLFEEKGVTADWLVTLRLTAAGLLLICIGLFYQRKQMKAIWKDRKDRKQLVLFSLGGMLFCQYTYFVAVEASNAGTATVLQSLAPLVILCIVCLYRKRLPAKKEAAGVFCALLGVFLLSTHGDPHSMNLSGRALFFGLGAAVSAAAYNVLSGDLLRKYGVHAIVGYAMLLAGIVLSLFVRPWRYAVVWDGEILMASLGVIIVGTALAFSLYLKGVSIVGPLLGSVLGQMEPVTAILVSVLFLGQKFAWMDFAGFVLILGTVAALSLQKKKK